MDTETRRRWIQTAFDAHGDRMLRFVARMVGEEAGRDIVQQTFMKLWVVDPPPTADHLAPWLYTVCRRAAIDRRRKESRMQVHHQQLRVAPAPRPPDAETRAEARGILDRIEGLPEAQREVLRLRFQSGLAYKDIAQVTGKPVGTVGSLMHAGIRALRRDLGEEQR